jgi:hypothetical protein
MGWMVSAKHGPLYAREENLVPVIREDGWDPGPVWTSTENLTPTGIRSPDHPACSESLYRMRHPVRRYMLVKRKIPNNKIRREHSNSWWELTTP